MNCTWTCEIPDAAPNGINPQTYPKLRRFRAVGHIGVAYVGGSNHRHSAPPLRIRRRQNCGFRTLQQCLADVRGIGGTCLPSPYYQGAVLGLFALYAKLKQCRADMFPTSGFLWTSPESSPFKRLRSNSGSFAILSANRRAASRPVCGVWPAQ